MASSDPRSKGGSDRGDPLKVERYGRPREEGYDPRLLIAAQMTHALGHDRKFRLCKIIDARPNVFVSRETWPR